MCGPAGLGLWAAGGQPSLNGCGNPPTVPGGFELSGVSLTHLVLVLKSGGDTPRATMRWGGALKEGLAPSSRSTSTQSPRAHPFLLLPCHLFSPSPFPCHSFSLSLSVSLCVSVSLFSICLPDSLSLLISISLSLLPFSVCLCLSPIHLCPEHATTSASSHTSCSHSRPPTSPHPTQALPLQAPSPLLTCQEFLVLLAPESGGSCV